MNPRRLADIRAGTASQQQWSGSGYLVGERLVLTSRHVFADDHGRAWPRLEVWLGHPSHGPRLRRSAAPVWMHPDRDAALLRIEGEPVTGAAPVRWGWCIGSSAVPYEGWGFPEFADYESGRGLEQLGGTLSPMAVGTDNSLVLDQAAAPETVAGRPWCGVSGAAVFCQKLLTAVVTRDDKEFGNRRLHAIPVGSLVAEPEFTHLVSEDGGFPPTLEAVELVDFLQRPFDVCLPYLHKSAKLRTGTLAKAHTPGSLLAAAAETVKFIGRNEELAKLAAWRDSNSEFSVMLVTGEGGQGKTRLARTFAEHARQRGWAAGFLIDRPSLLMPSGTRDQLPSAQELARQVQVAIRPVLLIVDYAETRPEEITALADIVSSGQPVRLLLLSRTAGSWWTYLAEALGLHRTDQVSLTLLTQVGTARQRAYAAAVTDLARGLAALPAPPVDRASDQSWSALAERLAANPPDLDDPRQGNALTLQITALTGLLSAAAGRASSGDSWERDLLGHERKYLRRAAINDKLFDPGILSDQLKDADRHREAWMALERALAGIIVLGPCDPDQARSIGMLASPTRAREVENWLAGLYPPPAEGFTVGTVQPDRLAELLLGPILIAQPDLLREIGILTDAADDAYAALFALMRTAAHSTFSQIGEQAAELIASRPHPFAVAAPALAATLAQNSALREGLIRLGRKDPQAFRQNAYTAINQLPETSVSGTAYKAALSTQITGVLQSLADAYPRIYMPDLATALNNLGIALSRTGPLLREAALEAVQEAADIYRHHAETDPDAYLPGLAMALNNLGGTLADLGQPQAALDAAQEAIAIRRQLAETNPDAHLPDLAISLNNLGIHLADAGQPQAALDAAQEAIAIRRQLAETNPDAHLPDLATALLNLGTRQAETGQPRAALDAAQEAVGIYRRLAHTNPDAHLPDLATSLTNLSVHLAAAKQKKPALAAAQEAVTIYHQLVGANPAAYLDGLAASLGNLSIRLREAGQQHAALTAIGTAINIYRQLADASPDAYLPHLARWLGNLSIFLALTGQRRAAVPPAQEAVAIYRPLAEAHPDTYRPELAIALDNLSDQLTRNGQQRAARAATNEARDIRRQIGRR